MHNLHSLILSTILCFDVVLSNPPISKRNPQSDSRKPSLVQPFSTLTQCGQYCRTPFDWGTCWKPESLPTVNCIKADVVILVGCNIDGSRLPTDPIIEANNQLPVFDPSCWCVDAIMEYTPQCIWCLSAEKQSFDVVSLLTRAYDLCISNPIAKLPCPASCGSLTQEIQSVVRPCQAEDSRNSIQQDCLCTATMRDKVQSCSFCLLGWYLDQSREIADILSPCRSSFSPSGSYSVDIRTVTTQRVLNSTAYNVAATMTLSSLMTTAVDGAFESTRYKYGDYSGVSVAVSSATRGPALTSRQTASTAGSDPSLIAVSRVNTLPDGYLSAPFNVNRTTGKA